MWMRVNQRHPVDVQDCLGIVVPFLIHKANTAAGTGGKTYDCGDCSFERLIRGAINYNGGGIPDYEKGICAALALSGCYPASK